MPRNQRNEMQRRIGQAISSTDRVLHHLKKLEDVYLAGGGAKEPTKIIDKESGEEKIIPLYPEQYQAIHSIAVGFANLQKMLTHFKSEFL